MVSSCTAFGEIVQFNVKRSAWKAGAVRFGTMRSEVHHIMFLWNQSSPDTIMMLRGHLSKMIGEMVGTVKMLQETGEATLSRPAVRRIHTYSSPVIWVPSLT